MVTKNSRQSAKKFKQNSESKIKGEIFPFDSVKEITPDIYEVVSKVNVKHLDYDIPIIEEESVDISEVNVSMDFLNQLNNKVVAITETLKEEEESLVENKKSDGVLDNIIKNLIGEAVKKEISTIVDLVKQLKYEIEMLKNKKMSFHIYSDPIEYRQSKKLKGASQPLIERDNEDFIS